MPIEATGSQTIPPHIPQAIHLIWFGDDLSDSKFEQYRSNIVSWKNNNPNYSVTLWVENKEKKSRYFVLYDQTGITVKAISSKKKYLTNYDLIVKHITQNNLWCASDTARVDIISAFGGFYFDIGIEPKKPLSEIAFNQKCYFEYKPHNGNTVGEYRFMAASKNHLLFRTAQYVLRVVDKVFNDESPYYDNPWLKHGMAIAKTGSALCLAMDALKNIGISENTNETSAMKLDLFAQPKRSVHTFLPDDQSYIYYTGVGKALFQIAKTKTFAEISNILNFVLTMLYSLSTFIMSQKEDSHPPISNNHFTTFSMSDSDVQAEDTKVPKR